MYTLYISDHCSLITVHWFIFFLNSHLTFTIFTLKRHDYKMLSFQEYKIFPELELVIDLYHGALDLNGLIAFKRRQVIDTAFSPRFDLIADSRRSVLNFEPSDVEMYADFVMQAGDVIGTRKTAFIADKPFQVVLATLFERFDSRLPHTFKVFSTPTGAINWIAKQGFTEGEFDRTISELIKKSKK